MSRLHRGRKLLQRALYNHALALGIVKGEENPGERKRDDEPGEAATKTASLAEYRARKRGAA